MTDSSLPLREYEMHIVAGLTDDGQTAISTKFVKADSDDLIPYFEGLGMLEAAKQNFIERWKSDE